MPDVPTELRARLRPEVVGLVGVALVAGVALRFVAATPMWLDEALTANIARLPPGELLEALRSDGHPPLYYLLLHGWGAVFGTSDAALRSLSGVLSLLALPLVWVAGRRFGGRVGGWAAVVVLAMNPFALRYATENRMYSLVALEVLAVWLLADDLWNGRSWRLRVPGLALAAGALLWTQYWGAFLLGAVGLVALWRVWRAGQPERQGSLAVLAGLVLGGVLFLPWVPSLLTQLGSTGTPWATGMRPSAAAGMFLRDFSGGVPNESFVVSALFGALLVLGLFGRASADANLVELDVRTTPTVRTEAVLAAVALGTGTAVGWVTDTAFAPRYAMVIVPFLVLMLAAGVLVVTHRTARAVVLALVILAGLVAGVGELARNRTQADEWSGAIAAEAQPGDVVALCPDQLGPAADRSLRQRLGDDVGGLEVVVVPTLGDPSRVDWVDYEARNTSADPAAVGRALAGLAGPEGSVFVVWNTAYLTYEGMCEGILTELSAAYPASTDLVESDGDDNFEHGTVTWFRR